MATLSFAFTQYLRHGQYLKNWSKRTTPIYERAFASFQVAVGDVTHATALLPADLTKAHLEAWIVDMRSRGLSTACTNMYIRCLNAFLRWLHENEQIGARLKAKQLPDPRNPPKVFTDSHIKALLAYRPVRFNQIRLKAIISTLLDTGLRIDELLTCKLADVDLDTQVMTVRGKGNRVRHVPVSHELRKTLFRYRLLAEKRQRSSLFLFATRSGCQLSARNVHRDIVVLATNLGVVGARVSAHTFRHFFAVSYIRNGGDIYSLSRILGHSTVSTTQIYLRSMGIEHLSELHSQYSPLSRLGK